MQFHWHQYAAGVPHVPAIKRRGVVVLLADAETHEVAAPLIADGLPVMGALPGLDNAFVSGGHGMMGITFGPGAASVMTDLVLCERHNPVLQAFSPARFSRRRRGAGVTADQHLQGVR